MTAIDPLQSKMMSACLCQATVIRGQIPGTLEQSEYLDAIIPPSQLMLPKALKLYLDEV